MQLLDLQLWDGRNFPPWMMIPASSKLELLECSFGKPPVSELWVHSMFSLGRDQLSTRIPNLKVLKSEHLHGARESDMLLRLLQAGKKNLEEGMEVEGTKMEPLEKLILVYYFGYFKNRMDIIVQLGEVVEEVVDFPYEPERGSLEV